VEGAVVALFSPHCQPCKERAPEFAAYASDRSSLAEPAIAVVVGSPAESTDMVQLLSPVAKVINGDAATEVAAAFRTDSYPSFYRMGPAGTVAASGHGMSVLPIGAAA
jgi:hypothetical protein